MSKDKITIDKKEWYNGFYEKIKKESLFLSPWNKKIIKLIKNINYSILGRKNVKILDIGCGSGQLLLYLANKGIILPDHLYGVDLSAKAISKIKNYNKIPAENLKVLDIEKEKLPFPPNYFDIIIMAEVIEHLENPCNILNEICRVLKNSGYLILSFPNYFNVPWLILRLLAEKLNKPQWIILQPIDKIYTVSLIKKIVERKGLKLIKIEGTVYFPPILYKYEPEKITNLLDKCRLAIFAFHPIMLFIKNNKIKDK